MLDLLTRIADGGSDSVITAAVGALASWAAIKLTGGKTVDTKPATPTGEPSKFGGLLHLLKPDSELMPLLSWFLNLPEEHRQSFFSALRKRLS